MHTAEQLRELALEVAEKGCGKAQAALLGYADLLEAMKEIESIPMSNTSRGVLLAVHQRADEKQKARKG